MASVTVKLGDEEYELVPSISAMRAISSASGGFTGAFSGINRFELSVYATIIAVGCGKKTQKEIREIEETIYVNGGMMPIANTLSRYLDILMNGGKDPDVDVEEGKDTGK